MKFKRSLIAALLLAWALPLQVGDNELWPTVTENFGGWGAQTQFDDLAGLKFK